MTAALLKTDQRVFVFQPKEGWDLSVVKDISHISKGTVTVYTVNNPRDAIEVAIKHIYVPSAVFAANDAEVPPDDLLALPELHHSILLHVLRKRHAMDYCYSYLGDLVVALNPFRYTIAHYQASMIYKYLECMGQANIATASHGTLRPHHWALAHRVYHNMLAQKRSQTVIISGESGSGKTEGCKMVLHYLCMLSSAKRQAWAAGSAPGAPIAAPQVEEDNRINAKVQQSNPILEAFGNAKTARNDNSSRFGKLMEVQFDTQGVLVGMKITAYLLEKLRVVTASQNERLYHAFYLLAYGAPQPTLLKYGIKRAADFRSLNAGGVTMVKDIDEAQGFADLNKAFGDVGLTEEEIDNVWRVVAAVMHLQNVEFVPQGVSKVSAKSKLFGGDQMQNDGAAMIDPASEEHVTIVATDLLRVDRAALAEALVMSINVVKGETIRRQLSKHKSEEQRDTLCKSLYSKLFFWIVNRINEAIAKEAEGVTSPGGGHGSSFIALLDIFGFEDFEKNSLEQLCINLANEALQRHYAKHVFERDRDEVMAEGVICDEVAFRDNQPCVDLIKADRDSIFSILDDASTLDLERATTDPNRTLLDRITAKFKPDFQSTGSKAAKSLFDRHPDEMKKPADFFNRAPTEHESFTVRHYAGDVKYHVAGFVEKNTDVLKENLKAVLLATTSEMVKRVMLTAADGEGQSESGSPSASRFAGNNASFGSPTSPRGPKFMAKTGVAAQFRQSLTELLRTIDNTQPSWIRCIRPHPKKEPGAFDGRTVLEQLVATGVLETINQRQRTFPFRMPLAEFVHKYGLIAGSNARPGLRAVRKSHHEVAAAVIAHAGLNPTTVSRPAGGGKIVPEGQVGKTKVFLSANAFQKLEIEARRRLSLHATTVARFILSRESRVVWAWIRYTQTAKKCQRIRRRRRCMTMLYTAAIEALRRKILASHIADQQTQLRDEAASRRDVEGNEQVTRSSLLRPFLLDLLPMIATVLKNVQTVETATRAVIATKTEPHDREAIVTLASKSKADAAARLQRRLQRERDECLALSASLLLQKEERSRLIATLESSERSSIGRRWEPVKRDIEKLWRRAELLRTERDRYVQMLEKERARELQRLTHQQDENAAKQAALWKAVVGREGLRADFDYLQRDLNLGSDAAAAQMNLYFAHNGPTYAVLPQRPTTATPSRAAQPTRFEMSPRSPRPLETPARDAPAQSPSTYRRRTVASYAEYSASWREAFAQAAASGQVERVESPSLRSPALPLYTTTADPNRSTAAAPGGLHRPDASPTPTFVAGSLQRLYSPQPRR